MTRDGETRPIVRRPKARSIAAAVLAASIAGFAVVGTGVAEADEVSCAPIIGVGIPGTNQGKAHSNGATDNVSMMGPQVAAVMDAISNEILGFQGVYVNYMAEGLGGIVGEDGAIAKLAYDVSVYKVSKDSGYNNAYQGVATLADQCPTARFLPVGYSQGGHIAADLVQSILDGHGPVGPERLAAAVILADPAFNGSSPHSNEFRFDGPKPGTAGFDRKTDTVVQDPDHWTISGALGTRAAYPDDAPVVSLCVYGDPVCDKSSVGLGGLNATVAKEKSWYHSLYTDADYTDSQTIATWAGKTAASIAKG